jgi:hypothetical protein
MKACPKQFPVENKPEEVKNQRHNPPVGGDALWSHLRRLEARVKALEEGHSVLRRDYNRLNSKVYREEQKGGPSFPNDNHDLDNTALLEELRRV